MYILKNCRPLGTIPRLRYVWNRDVYTVKVVLFLQKFSLVVFYLIILLIYYIYNLSSLISRNDEHR